MGLYCSKQLETTFYEFCEIPLHITFKTLIRSSVLLSVFICSFFVVIFSVCVSTGWLIRLDVSFFGKHVVLSYIKITGADPGSRPPTPKKVCVVFCGSDPLENFTPINLILTKSSTRSGFVSQSPGHRTEGACIATTDIPSKVSTSLGPASFAISVNAHNVLDGLAPMIMIYS